MTISAAQVKMAPNDYRMAARQLSIDCLETASHYARQCRMVAGAV